MLRSWKTPPFSEDRLQMITSAISTRCRFACGLFLLLASALSAPTVAFGWGGKLHVAITRAALETLPPWQRQLLGKELVPLAESHCLIPDRVFTDRENARYAMMDTRPGTTYLLVLHLPQAPPENLEALHYFLEKAVQAVRAGKMSDAARYLGTICHMLEDYGSPAHTVPRDNMFTLLKQFLPPPERFRGQPLHAPIESGTFTLHLKDYRPRLLGSTVNEAAWRLLHRAHEGILNARQTTIPIVQALYAGDAQAVEKHQRRAAKVDAQIVADAIYTVLCLGTDKFTPEELVPLKQVEISRFYPLEAPHLYFPQSQFFGKPYWGYPLSGFTLKDGKQPVPLKLKVRGKQGVEVKVFARGISAGMGRTLTFLLPEGVYSRFRVYAGLHATLGERGRVEFTVLGNGKPLQQVILSGNQPARLLECNIEGITHLALTLTSRTSASQHNYAVWAEPTLLKQP